MSSKGSTVVELLPHQPKVKGSNEAVIATTEGDKETEI
jgi:hypothetical protein